MIITDGSMPTVCEFCGSPLEWDGVNIICPNPDCNNINNERLKAWVMNIAPIDGLGWATIKKIQNFYFKDANTVEKLMDVAHSNVRIAATGEKELFNKMLNKLCEPVSVSCFLLALKIPGLGKIGAKNVEKAENAKIAFESILTSKYDNTLDFEMGLCGSQNIWTKLLQDTSVAKSLYTEYRDYFIKCYNLIKDQIIFDGLEDTKSVEAKGQVVITGTMSVKRNDFVKMLESWGWTIGSKINKNTKYLIINTPDSGTAKNKEADKFNIPKITEKDFYNIMKG